MPPEAEPEALRLIMINGKVPPNTLARLAHWLSMREVSTGKRAVCTAMACTINPVFTQTPVLPN